MISYRNIRLIIIAIITISLLALIPIFASKYRQRENIANEIVEINFSRESGFYDEGFYLEMSSSRGEIYYTLDGSVPTKDSIPYTGPIFIDDASVHDNVYSMRTDVSPAFRTDLTEVYSRDRSVAMYQAPDYNVDKCTVVRAIIYLGEDRYSQVRTASYFVGFQDKDGYEDMNVVSVVADPYDLFDYYEGIYVNGKTFDDYVAQFVNEDNYWYWEGSYTNATKEFSREIGASLSFFSTDRDLLLSQECGVRIHGGGSRQYNPKGLSIFAREEQDGNKYLNYKFFESDRRLRKLILSQGGDDYDLKVSDYIVSTLAKELDVSFMNYKPYVMFLNGEYWGVYWLTDKFDEEYINYYYNVDKDNIVEVKDFVIEIGESKDQELWDDMVSFCTENDLSNQDNYSEACEMIDIDSYIDYYAVLIYVDRYGDWPQGNFAAWRSRKLGDQDYEDGKWRWMLFDVNSYSLEEGRAEFDTLALTMEQDPMFTNFMSNDEFRNQFLDRLEYINNNIFSEEVMKDFFGDYYDLMGISLTYDHLRFFGECGYSVKDDLDSIERFFELRRDYIPELIDTYR